MEKITLEEAIKHCYEVLERNDLCSECKQEHLQLAKWLEKLFQLENLEEELGIDLITLFKALKDGILVNKGKWWFPRVLLVYMILDEEYAFICDDYIYKLKDYGNTWSLRKADLENEKED